MVTIKNAYLTAEIDETGSQLSRLASKNAEYIWNGSKDIWAKHAPVLFPFAGRLYQQKITYKGKEYGPFQIHGFAPYAKYQAELISDSSVRMRMIVDESIKSIWPFDFGFSVLFCLKDWTLEITYEVENKGEETMIYGMGSHPGFNVPMKDGLKFEDYSVTFPKAGNVMRNVMSPSTCLNINCQEKYDRIKNGVLPLSHDLFDNDAVILSNTGDSAVISTAKDSRKVTVSFPDTKYCAIWHCVKKEVPFVCIEPWTSLPGCDGKVIELTEKEDYNRLSAHSKAFHHLNITVSD